MAVKILSDDLRTLNSRLSAQFEPILNLLKNIMPEIKTSKAGLLLRYKNRLKMNEFDNGGGKSLKIKHKNGTLRAYLMMLC